MKRAPFATALVALAVLGIVALAGAVADLRQARTRVAVAAAALARPIPVSVPPVPPNRTVAAPAAAAATIRTAATRAGLLVERLDRLPAPAPLIRIAFVASGSGTAILRLAENVEGGRPLLRFADWRLAPTAGGAMRLTATIAAVGR